LHASDRIFYLVMAYTITLLVLAIQSQQRGRPAWTTGVRDGTLVSGDKTMGGASQVLATPPTIHQSYPMAAQQSSAIHV
jgi:hypothetical protein